MEPADATPDLVGRTSARLLADGVDRRERLEALHLLAVLDASTDVTGRVRRPLDDLAAEFELPPIGVLRSLDHLEHAGALQREGASVVLIGRDSDGIGGLHLADFLDDVRAALEPDHDLAPTRRTTWFVRTGAALAAAAAAFAVISLAPSNPTTPAPVAQAPSTTAARHATSTSSVLEPSVQIPNTVVDADPIDDGVTTTVAPTTDSTVVAAGQDACPSGKPVTEVVGAVIRITNPTSEDMVVTSLDLNGALIPASFTVPAGQTVDHQLPIAPPSASVDDWHFARDCG